MFISRRFVYMHMPRTAGLWVREAVGRSAEEIMQDIGGRLPGRS